MRLFLRSLLFTFFAITLNSVTTFSQTPTIKTDQLDYPPGSTVIITGAGWQPEETVTLQVLHEGETGDNEISGAHAPFTAIADGSGNISSTWTVPYDEDELGATLLLTAVGGSSGLTAQWTFTDALPDITASPASGSSSGGYQVTLTATSPSSFNSGGAPYSVTIDGVPVSPIVVVSAKVITFTAPAHTAGNVSIVVNGKNGPATNATNFTYGKADQTITFGNLGAKIYGDAAFPLGATSSSGLTVSYSSSNTNVATVSGNTVTIVGAGSTTITASQAGNDNYNAATNVDQTLTVNKAEQTITWANPADITYGTLLSGTQLNAVVTGVTGGSATGTVTYTPAAGILLNAGSGQILHVDVAATDNYNAASKEVSINVNKAEQTITWANPADITYGTLLSGTQLNAVVTGITGGSATGAVTYTPAAGTLLNAGTSQTLHVDVAATDNYNAASKDVSINVNQRPIAITPTSGQFKYCGQPDPVFTYAASESLIPGNSYSGGLSRSGTNDVGIYNYLIGTLSAGNNYILTLAGSNTFEIKGVSIDASNTSTAIQLGTATKILTATVTSGTALVSNATVTFTVTNNGNITPIVAAAVTNSSGVATYNLPSGSLATGLYQVTAVAGTGCAQSVAYFSVYDPSAGFVTGGGWINSPAGAYSADPSLTGKANFGFNAQYKKGNNVPDGNTEFQFQAGNLNFKSTNYATGSLVIAGAKAIFQGTGTINGTGTYNFMISAIDGSISGGGGVDKFRIKIWTNADGSGVIYDNNKDSANNAVPSTVLGGGSIVIHSTGNTKSRLMDTASSKLNVSMINNPNNISSDMEGNGKLSIQVMPNPTSYYFTLILKSLGKENVKLTVTDITGRVVEQRTSVLANSSLQLGSQYHPGIYIAEFMQGNDRITLRLIKEGK
ncbi:MAG: beta strand repeat-containing protein [Ginsengibacter sp.]